MAIQTLTLGLETTASIRCSTVILRLVFKSWLAIGSWKGSDHDVPDAVNGDKFETCIKITAKMVDQNGVHQTMMTKNFLISVKLEDSSYTVGRNDSNTNTVLQRADDGAVGFDGGFFRYGSECRYSKHRPDRNW